MLDVLLEFLLLVIYPSFRSASAVQRRQGQVGKEQVSSFPTNTTRTWYMVQYHHGNDAPYYSLVLAAAGLPSTCSGIQCPALAAATISKFVSPRHEAPTARSAGYDSLQARE